MKKRIMMVFLLMIMMLGAVSAQDSSLIKMSIAKTDPIIVKTGDYFDLYIKVDNVGNGDAKGLVVEFENNYPFTVEDEKTEEIGLLGSYNDYVVDYRVRVADDAQEGDNILKLRYSLDGKEYVTKEFTINVKDQRARIVVGTIESSPLSLIADIEDAQLTVTLQNVGESTAKLVSAKLELPEGFEASSSFSDMDMVSSIEAEDSQDAVFHIDIEDDVKEGVYEGKLIVSYKEDDDDIYSTEELDIKLPVKSTPLFEIEGVEFDKESLKQDDIVEMIVNLKNVGGKDAESVSIRAFQSVGLPVEFDEKSSFIGTIKSGETGQASLKFTIDKDATPKNYLLDLEIRAVSDDEVLVFDRTTSFDIENGSGSNMTAILVGLIVLSAIGAGFYFYKKK